MPGVTLGALQGEFPRTIPTEWEEVGVVERLFIYPIKSLAAREVATFSTGKFAAQNGNLVDRQFCVIKQKDRKIISSRRYPAMSLIQVTVSATEVTLSTPNRPSIKVARAGNKVADAPVNVFGDMCLGVDLGDKIGSWFAETIGEAGGIRVIEHGVGDSSRPDKETDEYLTPLGQPQDKPIYADGFAYMMMTTKSIAELNSKLKMAGEDLEVEVTRFRPNILVSGDFPAFAEDKWAWIKIGDAVWRNIRPSDRCIFTTVDPFKGEKHPKGQPLKMLKEFRSTEDQVEKKKVGMSPFFGVNLGLEVQGDVKVGDKIFVCKAL